MNNFLSVFEQIAHLLDDSGYCVIKRKNEKKSEFYLRKLNRIERIDENMFSAECRKMLMTYLNPSILNQLIQNAEKSITKGNITIRLEELKSAERNGFLLIHETEKFIEVLRKNHFFIKNEKDFMPESKQIPIKNGIISFFDSKFEFLRYDREKVFFSQINACYFEGNQFKEFPELFMHIIRNGITNRNLSPQENENRIDSFLDCLAYIIIPGNPCCKFFWIYGATQAGKSILMKILTIIFGDYATEIDANSITAHSRPNQEIRPDLLKLVDKKFIACSETEKTKKLDSRLIKTITGGDGISVRASYSNNISEAKIDGKIFFVSNFKPVFVNPEDEAIRERAVIIDWHNTVPEDERIHDLVKKLTTDEMRNWIFSALLLRAVDLFYKGSVLKIHSDFQYIPPPEPFNIKNARQELFDRFCDECIFIWDIDQLPIEIYNEKTIPISGSDIHKAYLCYSQLNGYYMNVIMMERAFLMKFGKFIQELNSVYPYVEKKSINGSNYYTGFNIDPNLIHWQMKVPIAYRNQGGFNNPCVSGPYIPECNLPEIGQEDMVNEALDF